MAVIIIGNRADFLSVGALEKVFSSNFISTRTTSWRFVGSITSSIFMATVESMLNRKPKEKFQSGRFTIYGNYNYYNCTQL